MLLVGLVWGMKWGTGIVRLSLFRRMRDRLMIQVATGVVLGESATYLLVHTGP
jgi:hypothetical protein